MGNKTSQDNVIHDFTHAARNVVEATIGRKLTTPPARETLSPSGSAISAIVRRSNIRSTVRLTGMPRNEVKKIILTAGQACARFHFEREVPPKLTSLRCTALPAIRDKHQVAASKEGQLSYAWTCTALDSRSAFVPMWQTGPKDAESIRAFLVRTSSFAPAGIVVALDGLELRCRHNTLPDDNAMRKAFGPPIHFTSQAHNESGRNSDFGILAPWLGELPNGFAEKVRRHASLLALLFTYHNFASQNSHGVSPAMAAEVADHVWTIEELLSRTGAGSKGGAAERKFAIDNSAAGLASSRS